MAERRSYAIVGNGIAGITAAETLRQEQPSAEITIVAETPAPACYRPALKDYLVGRVSEETLFARRPGYYAEKNMRFLADRVVQIAVDQHRLLLSSGQTLAYDRLLLATGARARRLSCPGSELAGVLTLRVWADYTLALRFLETARRVVVCGGGPLALETVDMLRQRGLQVTHLLRRRGLWANTLDRTASELLLHQEKEAGVDVRLEEEITEIIGKQGQVVGLITGSGARIPCDMLVMAIGAEPMLDYTRTGEIACQRGILVDHAMRTSAADVFAAGDVAETLDPLTGQTRIAGQWYPAMQQGRAAAYSMLDMLDALRLRHAASYSNAYLRPISTYALFGFDIAAIGLTSVAAPNYQEVVADPRTHIYSKALLRNGVPVGMLSFDGQRDMLAFKRAIDHAVDVTAVISCLFDREFKFATWLDAQKVPAPVLAVRKTGALPAVSPASSMKNQFAPALSRPHDNPYTLPVIAAARPAGRESDASRFPGAHEYAHASIPTAAFLAPVLPARIALTLTTGEGPDRAPTLILDPQGTDLAAAPESTHTALSASASTTIGREATATLVINHYSISRHHAEISCINGVYLLRDLDSKNGTFINETRLAPGRAYALKQRDSIRIGNLATYQFQVRAIAPR